MNDDLVVQKISKLLENNTAFIGYALNGGIGTKINVRNTETGKTIQALSINVDSSGEVLVVKDSADNQYKVVTFKTAEKVNTRNIQLRKTRIIEEIPKMIKPEIENIKILFYVNCEISPFTNSPTLVERLWKELWIGGTWPVKKVYTVPEGYRLADAFIVNTGEKEEDYIIMGRLFPVQKVHRWYESVIGTEFQSILANPASIFLTIEKGVVTQRNFGLDSCHPYFWRYCGGGFFYSSGSDVGINTIEAASGHVTEWWPKSYNGYSTSTSSFYYGRQNNSSSFINFAFYRGGMSNYSNPYLSYVVTPGSYTPVLENYSSNEMMFSGTDISSKWYYKTKTIETKNINTFYSFQTPQGDPGKLGFIGEMCITPTKNFAVDYQASISGSDLYAASFAKGFLYEPLIVNNSGTKTLAIKQISTKAYDRPQTNYLLVLSDAGESSIFTQMIGIPELNNFNALGLLLTSDAIPSGITPTAGVYPYVPLSFGGYSSILSVAYYHVSTPIWSNFTCTLQNYYKTGNTFTYSSLSTNQSELNKETLYLKDFLLNFATFTGLATTPLNDVRTSYSTLYNQCQYLKPLSSYIENSIYILYGFIDTNNTFYGSQSFRYEEPEKTRVLPKTSKATIKVVELKLNEVTAQVTVANTVKSLLVYMVTPEKTGSSTIALASANYWCKEKTKGKPMPIFTPTPSEVFQSPPSQFVN